MPIPRRATVERRIQERIDAIDLNIETHPRAHDWLAAYQRGLRDALAIVRGEYPPRPDEPRL